VKSSGVAAGVGTVVDFVRGAEGLTGEPTAANVLTQLKKAKGTLFLSGGLKFNCDGSAIPLLPNICSAQFQMAVLNANGTIKSATTVDATALFK
jgi:branched-chain amino acid transport system substrate-binding protein